MKVDQVMTVNPTCCARSDTAEHAAELMRKLNVGALPVVENEQSYKLVGVVTDRDLCLSVVADGRDPKTVAVADCMSDDLITCAPDAELESLTLLMQKNQVRRVLVVDKENRIEGIVSTADLVLHSDADAEVIDETLRDISEPKGEIV